VLAPCGALSAGALQYRAWKKWPIRFWFVNRALREANCLHAKSEIEYSDFRRCGLTNPIAIVPNPVDSPKADCTEVSDLFGSNLPLPPGKKILLYLGRLHPVKGLERLIEVWARLKEFRTGWILVLVGPDEDSFRSVLKKWAASLNCSDSTFFPGALHGDEKWRAYAAASLFVMPSDFENFGIAIAEALMAGLPVITTTGTPWNSLRRERAGWWVPPDVPSLTAALKEALSLSDAERAEMGLNGKRLAAAFDSKTIVGNLIAVYDWMLGKRECPQVVRMD
jgi:glycosyltransferase involved in cell wall biosynthesis